MSTTEVTTTTQDVEKKQGLETTEKQQMQKIRITLTARDVKSLESSICFILTP
jgi:hypothetical protein